MKKLVSAGYTALAEWRITDNDMEQRAELLAGLRGEAA
jgi:hypothetical protein